MSIVFFLFILLLFLPFGPGIYEYLKRKDINPLFINIEYTKNPRYFSLSFKRKLKESVKEDILKIINETKEITFFNEKLKITIDYIIEPNSKVDEVLYVFGDFKTNNNVILRKEVYVRGSAYIGENNNIRALACDKKIFLGRNVKVIRWLDAEEDIYVEENCDLGVSTTSNKKIIISKGCVFKRLFAPEIQFNSKASEVILDNRKARIIGNIKTYKDISFEGSMEIIGNVFSEKDINIGEKVWIKGNVFSQGKINLGGNAQIGEEGKIKSVIAKKGIVIKDNARIYGYVMTEGEGKVE